MSGSGGAPSLFEGPVDSPPLPARAAGFVADHVTAVGDSITIDAQGDLESDIPGISV